VRELIIHDREIIISAGGSRKALLWPQQKLYWSELVEKLRVPVRGTETLAEYLSYPKSKQDELKDVGGFVAGSLKDNKRKGSNVLTREVITLDLDNLQPGCTDAVLRKIEGLSCGYVVYSTRKHQEAKPRLRVLVPLDKSVSAEEYEPITRKLAEIIGMELCDPTTFEASRLMYWPSCSADSKYVYSFEDKPFLHGEGMLSLYKNWRDISEWPEVPGLQQTHIKLAAKQGNPLEKAGIVGAFCKTYDIYKAMEVFLPGVYLPCEEGSGRFTYAGGSTTGGAVIYEKGSFLYSHHSTDPASGRLCNSFDLVRLHKFSKLDEESKDDTPVNKLPSYLAMCEAALKDDYVKEALNQERYEKALTAFEAPLEEGEDTNWMSRLELNGKTGLPEKTIENVLIILEKDPLLKGKIAFDEFASRTTVMGGLPWDDRSRRRQWSDNDEAGVIHYLEHVHKIFLGDKKTSYAISLCAFRHSFDDVKNYLENLKWDGIKRIDTLLTDYLGAVDSGYTRAVIRKSLVAAVARVMKPGCKYDYVPIFVGRQGLGKSTFLKLLGKAWYSESLEVFEGKTAAELIQGTWINELGELKGFNKYEANSIKQFISRTEDIFRKSYGHNTDRYPRRCVFFGTSNDSEFLKDITGNRRFWPVDVGINKPVKNVWRELPEEVDQIWAEAYARWQAGEQIYLSEEIEKEAFKEQELHSESDAREGLILEFVGRPVPTDWDKRSLNERKLYWTSEFGRLEVEVRERDRICALEVWCECLGNDLRFVKQIDTRIINGILKKALGWEGCRERFGCYGLQRGFRKQS
jgi:hypothetical protein